MTQKYSHSDAKTKSETVDSTNASIFFELVLDLMCILNRDGIILQVNPALKNTSGLSDDQLIGTAFSELIEVEAKDSIQLFIARINDDSEPVSLEAEIQAVDGSPMWYLWTLYPKSEYIYAIGRDISPYKEMELREYKRNIFAEALLDTVLAINASLSLEQVLERILANIGKVVAYDYVNILLVDGTKADVVGYQTKMPHQIEVNLEADQQFSIPDDRLLDLIFTKRECLIIPYMTDTPRWMNSLGGQQESGSFLGAPIIVEEQIIGFLCIFNSQSEFFTPLHAQQLQTFANQVGIAIANARLYEQSQSVAILRERQRVAQELHDSVNQDLFAASTYADLLLKAIDSKPDAIQRYAGDINRLVRGSVEQMRMILIELHPDTLTGTALPTLIQQLANTLSNRTGIQIDFHADSLFALQAQEQIAVYRITQEALHNIEKHAQARHVSIDIQRADGLFQLSIADDGIGFQEQYLSEFQFGIRGMQDRATKIQATLDIESVPGKGTKIICKKDYKQ